MEDIRSKHRKSLKAAGFTVVEPSRDEIGEMARLQAEQMIRGWTEINKEPNIERELAEALAPCFLWLTVVGVVFFFSIIASALETIN